MRNSSVSTVLWLLVCLFIAFPAPAGERPRPFGFTIGKTSHAAALTIARQRNWRVKEYEKKTLKLLKSDDPARGRNTFIKASPKNMEGVRSVFLFFNNESILDAVMLTVDPALLKMLIEKLSAKYTLVKKNLLGESLGEEYPFVLWEQAGVFIELQSPGHGLLRLIYVDKLLYENYRNFLHETYQPFRPRQKEKSWMNDL